MRRMALVLTCLLLALPLMSSAPSVAAGGHRTVTYKGHGVTVRLDSVKRLHATSRDFRSFTRTRLVQLWKGSGTPPRCRSKALVSVKRWRSDGWARIDNEGIFGRGPCGSGGNRAIWRRHRGHWREILGTQELYSCDDLYRYRVPFRIADPTCYNADQGTIDAYEPGL
ncbi:hypothetical protein BH11ACT8_BH11ACT8_33050 [soil metagenome]